MRAGILLAAGRGARMGGPKAFLAIAGRTLLEQHLRRLHEVGCREVLAVIHPEDDVRARAIADRLPFSSTLVAAATDSQAASLAAALGRVVLASADPIAITPVDLLPAARTTFEALASAIGRAFLAATPMHRGSGGHPVVVRASVLDPYRRGETPPLRAVLAGLANRRARIEVDDPSVLGDLDHPTQLGGRDEKSPPPQFQDLRPGAHGGSG